MLAIDHLIPHIVAAASTRKKIMDDSAHEKSASGNYVLQWHDVFPFSRGGNIARE